MQTHQVAKAGRSDKDASKAPPAATPSKLTANGTKHAANGAKLTANGTASAPAPAVSVPQMPQSFGMGSIAAMAAAAGQSSSATSLLH